MLQSYSLGLLAINSEQETAISVFKILVVHIEFCTFNMNDIDRFESYYSRPIVFFLSSRIAYRLNIQQVDSITAGRL